MYEDCNSMKDARDVFAATPLRDVYVCSAMIAAEARVGDPREAIRLFHNMQQHHQVRPNSVTCVSAINACARIGDSEEGRRIHEGIIQSGLVQMTPFLASSLIAFYGACGPLAEVQRLFEEFAQFHADGVVWNAAMAACVNLGHPRAALEYFDWMRAKKIRPTPSTFINALSACTDPKDLSTGQLIHSLIRSDKTQIRMNANLASSLVTMYGRCGSVEEAIGVFNDTKPLHNVVVENAMIAVLTRANRSEEPLAIFRQIQNRGGGGTKKVLDPLTLRLGLRACSTLDQVREIQNLISSDQSPEVFATLISVYAHLHNLADARAVFDRVSSLGSASIWNAMMMACADLQPKSGPEISRLYKEMISRGIKPDKDTFGILLSSCTDLDEGRVLQEQIVQSGIKLDALISAALISMFRRCGGSLEEAKRVFEDTRRTCETSTCTVR